MAGCLEIECSAVWTCTSFPHTFLLLACFVGCPHSFHLMLLEGLGEEGAGSILYVYMFWMKVTFGFTAKRKVKLKAKSVFSGMKIMRKFTWLWFTEKMDDVRCVCFAPSALGEHIPEVQSILFQAMFSPQYLCFSQFLRRLRFLVGPFFRHHW